MSLPARDNQITPGAVLAWLLVIALTVIVLFLLFQTEAPEQRPDGQEWSTEGYESPTSGAKATLFERLADMEWLLVQLTLDGASQTVSEEVESTFRCDANGRYSGNAGCNNYFGQFTEEDGALATGPIGTTMMACPPPKSQRETAYLAALGQTTHLELEGHRLVLRNQDGDTEMVFRLLLPVEFGEIEEGDDEQEPGGGTVRGGGGNIDVDAQSGGGKTRAASLIYRGLLRTAKGELSFRPCGAEFELPLEEGAFRVENLEDEMGQRLETGLYVEFRARFSGDPAQSAELTLQEPLFMAVEGGSCEHLSPVASLIASGNEPFWTLVVEDSRAGFKTPDGQWELEGGMHPDDAFFNSPGGVREIAFHSADDGLQLTLRVQKEPCRDTMVDAWSLYRASVEYQGKRGEGCARPGRFHPSLAGRYGAELPAASGPGRSLRLDLEDSGRAVLGQDHHNGEAAIVQQGIWQLRDRNTAEIRFVSQDGKPVFERMVLSGDGNTLAALEYDARRWGSQGLRLARIVD